MRHYSLALLFLVQSYSAFSQLWKDSSFKIESLMENFLSSNCTLPVKQGSVLIRQGKISYSVCGKLDQLFPGSTLETYQCSYRSNSVIKIKQATIQIKDSTFITSRRTVMNPFREKRLVSYDTAYKRFPQMLGNSSFIEAWRNYCDHERNSLLVVKSTINSYRKFIRHHRDSILKYLYATVNNYDQFNADTTEKRPARLLLKSYAKREFHAMKKEIRQVNQKVRLMRRKLKKKRFSILCKFPQ